MPDFRPDDTVKVHVRVVEGRERIQIFRGFVLRRQVAAAGDLLRPQGLLRRRRRADLPGALAEHRQGRAGHRGDVRRAKLYLRERTGRAAKIKEKRSPAGPSRGQPS